jgi:hypothetical protein
VRSEEAAHRRRRRRRTAGRATASSGGVAASGELTLGHILKTFLSHDCDWEKRLLVLDRSRRVARGGVETEDPGDTAVCVACCMEKLDTGFSQRIRGVSRVECSSVVGLLVGEGDKRCGRLQL